MSNPLRNSTDLPKFNEIRAEHVMPAVQAVLAENKQRISERLRSHERPNWENVAEFFADLDDAVDQVWSPVRHLNAVANNEQLRKAHAQCLPLIDKYYIELGQNHELYELWRALERQSDALELNSTQKKLIQDTLLEFRLTGIDLNERDRNTLLDLKQRLSILESKFEENILDATDGWSVLISDRKKLNGLPETNLIQASDIAKKNGEEGYRLGLDYPTYDAIMSYCENRDIRQEFYTAFSTRASDKGPQAGSWDNSAVLREILELRTEIARTLGMESYAHLSLTTKMADSPEDVIEFLNDLAEKVRKVADHQFYEVEQFATKELDIQRLESWDLRFVSRQLKEEQHRYDEEKVKEYFPVTQVISGLFDLVSELFGVKIKEHPGQIPVWHEDVKVYDVFDKTGYLKAQFYLDLYSRPQKRGGAWMDECRGYRIKNNKIRHPVAYITCNSSSATGDKPALFTHDDVVTLFHEFGHGLHHMLTKVPYAQLAGIKGVEWDAVELPSQFMENWCWNDQILKRISKHYKTNDSMPESIRRSLIGSRKFQAAMQLLRQIEFALFDMKIHMQNSQLSSADIQNTLDNIRHDIAVLSPPEFNRFQHSFSHIFAGGYAAGYYSYLWAEVLSADAFSKFEEEGVFNPGVGKSFQENILEKGGSDEAMNLFIRFRGRKPKIDALNNMLGING